MTSFEKTIASSVIVPWAVVQFPALFAVAKMTLRRKSVPGQLSYPGNDSNLRNNTNIELLAYLHYCTALKSFPHEPETFHKLAISHLNASINRTFTVEELRARLRYLWDNWRPTNAKPSSFRQLYTLGIRCLPRVNETLKEEAIRRANDIQKTAGQTRALRSTSRPPVSNRTTPRKRTRRKARGHPRSKDEQRLLERTPISSHATQSGPLASENGPEEPTVDHRSLTPVTVKNESPAVEINNSQEASSQDGRFVRVDTELSDSDSIGIDCKSESRSYFETPTPFNLHLDLDYGNTARLLNLRPSGPHEHGELQCTHELKTELEVLRIQKNNEIAYLRDRCELAEAKYVRLQSDYDRLHATAMISGPELLNIYDKHRLQEKNAQLRRELDRMQSIMAFSISSPETFPRIDRSDLDLNMKSIHSKLRDVLQDYETVLNFQWEDVRNLQDLSVLIQRVFCFESGQTVDPAHIETVSAGVQTKLIIRCLLSAALCEWVFEADLRSLFQESDRLYPKLRELLARQSM